MEVPHGYIKDGNVFREAFLDHPALLVKEIEDSDDEKAIISLVDSFKKIDTKLNTLTAKIDESQNKGSFYSGLMDIKTSLSSHKGLGDYESLMIRIGQYESMLEDYMTKNRQKNTDIKQALLLELEAAVGNNDMHEAFEQVKDVQARWIKTGSPLEDIKKELEERFQERIDLFFEKRRAFQEAKNELNAARESDYQEVIDQVSQIIKAGTHLKSQQKVKALQKEWKEKGRIPEDTFKKLNETYWNICKQFYDELKKKRIAEKKQRNKSEADSLQEREQIMQNLELLAKSPLSEDAQYYKSLKKSWKNAGSLPKAKYEVIQKKFMDLCDTINEQLFAVSLVKGRDQEYGQKSEVEKLEALKRVMKKLLKRDQDELASFEENMDKMHINKGSFVDMLQSKLEEQKKKVNIKKFILKNYREAVEQTKS